MFSRLVSASFSASNDLTSNDVLRISQIKLLILSITFFFLSVSTFTTGIHYIA